MVTVVYSCDSPGCITHLVTPRGDARAERAAAHKAGWQVRGADVRCPKHVYAVPEQRKHATPAVRTA